MGGPFFGPEEEFECPEEEECEIDWDMMPGFDEEEEEESQEQILDTTTTLMAEDIYDDMDGDLDKGRVKLEVNWQVEECETHEDTCSDFCPDCAGSGTAPCRFCKGSGQIPFLVMGDQLSVRACLICREGEEHCTSCKGTGQIAPWATTMMKFQKKSNKNENDASAPTPP